MNTTRFLANFIALLCVTTVAHAGLTAAVTPSFQGSPCARFAGWEVFTQAYNAPNLPDVSGSNATTAEITQLVPGAILTSTGNIYHPFQPTAFRLTDTAPSDVQEVVLQVSTFGNSRNAGSFILTYVDASQNDVVLAPTQYLPLVSMPQQHDELYFQWDLSAIADVVLAYRIEWLASAPSMSFDAALLDVRHACAPGVGFCSGDGSGTACPCANVGSAGNGCGNSLNAAGAHLSADGYASIASDSIVLSGSGMPNSTCLYFQGTSQQAGGLGAIFGDGLRCVSGTIVRLGTAQNTNGASTYPTSAQPSVSVRGGITMPGTIACYQAWYRNAATFCAPGTFNLSNGYQITWSP